MLQRHQFLKVLIVIVLMPLPAVAASFKCPASEAPQGSSNPNLTSAEMPGPQPRISEPLRTAIERMQKDGMKSGDIVDGLVRVYCSRIEPEPSLSNEKKAEQVRRFASNLARVVYRGSSPDEEDILFDVPIPAALSGQIQHAAETAHVSVDTWIVQAIKQQLDKRP